MTMIKITTIIITSKKMKKTVTILIILRTYDVTNFLNNTKNWLFPSPPYLFIILALLTRIQPPYYILIYVNLYYSVMQTYLILIRYSCCKIAM